jgi:DNA polymerase-3 subunit gamma/tau
VAYCGRDIREDDVNELLGNVGSELLAQCLRALFQQDVETALRLVNQLQSEGQEAVSIIRALLEGLRHLVILKTTQGPHELIPLSEMEIATLHPVADMASVEDIYGFFHILSAAENNLRYVSNPFLILEMALVRMACIGRVQPLQTILATLQSLGTTSPLSTPHVMPSFTPSMNVQAGPSSGLQLSRTSAISVNTQNDSSPDTPAAPADFWQTLQEHVAEQRPSIAAFLQAGRILSRTDKELVIGFAKQDSFSRETLLDPENLVVVREAVNAVLGQSLQVKIEAFEGPASTDNGTQGTLGGSNASALAIEELQRQKRETIQAVLDIFDGRLIM